MANGEPRDPGCRSKDTRMSERVGKKRQRSAVDGVLRYRCSCERLIAEDADWKRGDIEEGDRDDLCWGYFANHETSWPPEVAA